MDPTLPPPSSTPSPPPAPPRRARRWLGWVVFGALVLLAAWLVARPGRRAAAPTAAAERWREEVLQGTGPHRIALVEIRGVLTEDGAAPLPEWSSGFRLAAVREQLRRAAEGSSVRAVVLRIDSPGGSVVASEELYQAVKQLRKPVVASLGETAASGGYYVAVAADRIVASPGTITGSIGVIATVPDVGELARKVGYRQTVIKSGEFKDMGNPLRAITPRERALFQALVDDLFQGFVDRVAEGRRLPRARVLTLATGQVYTGAQALRLGLVDEVGDLQRAIERARSLARVPTATVIRYVRREPRIRLLDLLLSGSPPGLQERLDAARGRWLRAQFWYLAYF
jgi:protease-4